MGKIQNKWQGTACLGNCNIKNIYSCGWLSVRISENSTGVRISCTRL